MTPRLVLLPLFQSFWYFFLFGEQTKFVFTSWPCTYYFSFWLAILDPCMASHCLGFIPNNTSPERSQANCTNASPRSTLMWSHYPIALLFSPYHLLPKYLISFLLVYGWNVKAQCPFHKGPEWPSSLSLSSTGLPTLDDNHKVHSDLVKSEEKISWKLDFLEERGR